MITFDDFSCEITNKINFKSSSHYENFLNYLFNIKEYQSNELTKLNSYYYYDNNSNSYTNLAIKTNFTDSKSLEAVSTRKKILDYFKQESSKKKPINTDIIYFEFNKKFDLEDAKTALEMTIDDLIKTQNSKDVVLFTTHINQILPVGVGTSKEKPAMPIHIHRVFYK